MTKETGKPGAAASHLFNMKEHSLRIRCDSGRQTRKRDRNKTLLTSFELLDHPSSEINPYPGFFIYMNQ